jgi:hypothetical protein
LAVERGISNRLPIVVQLFPADRSAIISASNIFVKTFGTPSKGNSLYFDCYKIISKAGDKALECAYY